MSDAQAVRREAIRVAIQRHLRAYPAARDTAAGICAWWLPGQGVTEMGHCVEEVLEQMVEQGILRRTVLIDGTVLYGAA